MAYKAKTGKKKNESKKPPKKATGSGYARKAAEAADKRNKKTKAVERALFGPKKKK